MEVEYGPATGRWPVDSGLGSNPLISKDRVWVDGCFDFSHHGHAGAMLQARRLGKYLCVGIHSDEAILENKGPTVMTLKERVSAVEACRWSSLAIPHAPYVTQLDWISHYGCHSVVHGDDITSDSNGEDCYRFVKAADRFLVVKRTPGISTTDLVGRMLLCTRQHFLHCLSAVLNGTEGPGSEHERKQLGQEMRTTISEYASDESGAAPGSEVYTWAASQASREDANTVDEEGTFSKLVSGKGPKPGQRIVYVDGGFDLFSSGHIEFLKLVVVAEYKQNPAWNRPEAKQKRIEEHGDDFGPAYVVAGVHDDEVINEWKGVNYPIMNIFERGLCVLQCRYIHAIVFSAPFTPTKSFLEPFPHGPPSAVYHGPTSFMPLNYDPYTAPKAMGIFREVGEHDYQSVNAGTIVQRIMRSRDMYEERQRVKGVKGIGEEAVKRREEMEKAAEEAETKRAKANP